MVESILPAPPLELEPITDGAGLVTLSCLGQFPAFLGTFKDGRDHLCAHCHQFVVARSLRPGQVWDVAVRCPLCTGLSRFPPLPPGLPLSPRRTYTLVPHEAILRQPIGVVLDWSVFVSTPSADRYEAEVGYTLPRHGRDHLDRKYETKEFRRKFDGRAPGDPPLQDLTHALEAMPTRARNLLGGRYHRVIANGCDEGDGRPWRECHPLGSALRRLPELISSSKSNRGVGPVEYVVELVHDLDYLEQWSHHPAFADAMRDAADAQSFIHLVMQLTVATNLLQMGNPVTLRPADPAGGRSCDLLMMVGPLEFVRVEVKVPVRLRRPLKPLGRVDAREAIRSAGKNAGFNESGQLPPPDTAILILGGFGLADVDLKLLEEETTRWLRRGPAKPHLAGVTIVSINGVVNGVRLEGSQLVPKTLVTTFGTYSSIHPVWNPGYTGELTFDSSNEDGLETWIDPVDPDKDRVTW